LNLKNSNYYMEQLDV